MPARSVLTRLPVSRVLKRVQCPLGIAPYAGYSASEFSLLLSAGVVMGLGLSGTTFPVIFGVISRALPPEKRSWAMSVGSIGQFVLLPGSDFLIAIIFLILGFVLLMYLSRGFILPLMQNGPGCL